MRRFFETWIVPFGVFVPAAAFGRASIAGVVKDTSGAVLPGVTVEAGPQVSANFVASNAAVAPSRGRPLSGGATSLTLQMIPPGQSSGERLNQLDVRVAKILRYRTLRLAPRVDVFNVTNGNAVLQENPSYGAFRRPIAITPARLVKFSLNMTF